MIVSFIILVILYKQYFHTLLLTCNSREQIQDALSGIYSVQCALEMTSPRGYYYKQVTTITVIIVIIIIID